MRNCFFLLILLVFACGACSSSREPFEARSETFGGSGVGIADTTTHPGLRVVPAEVEIFVDSDEKSFGAYEFELRYAAEVVTISSVQGGGGGGFPGAPMANAQTFASGATRIVGFYSGSAVPKGRLKVATVEFSAVKPGVTPITALLKALYDPDGKPISGTVTLSANEVRVEKYPP